MLYIAHLSCFKKRACDSHTLILWRHLIKSAYSGEPRDHLPRYVPLFAHTDTRTYVKVSDMCMYTLLYHESDTRTVSRCLDVPGIPRSSIIHAAIAIRS